MIDASDMPPGNDKIEAMARAAIAELPEAFRAEAEKVVLRVEDFASDGMLNDLEIPDPFALTGLYEGVPLTEKSVLDQAIQPDVIWLFRRAILDEWVERGDVGLSALVAHVFLHELAHHFGWSDTDIAAIDEWWA
ncbi:MAG: metallopeptidase family protein [Boseongicola sp.]|nr:metallopeptidase family protein [Boseongicola sp.]NNL19253.1 metallopeptidase family protein [Boseongicola sp.]